MSAEVLRRMVPYLRNPYLCNWDHNVARALADWLERTANDFAALVKTDAPDCPNCSEGCAGHPQANFCDRCGDAVESLDYAPCRCWTEALATARALAVNFGLAPEQLELPVGYRLTCPGVAEYDRGLTAATVHVSGCCERFAALPAVEQERTGLRIPKPA